MRNSPGPNNDYTKANETVERLQRHFSPVVEQMGCVMSCSLVNGPFGLEISVRIDSKAGNGPAPKATLTAIRRFIFPEKFEGLAVTVR